MPQIHDISSLGKIANNILEQTGWIGSVIDVVRDIVREKKTSTVDALQKLLRDLYYGAAFDEFNERLYHNHICNAKAIQDFWTREHLKGSFPCDDFAEDMLNGEVLQKYYANLFRQMGRITREQNLLDEEAVKNLFQNIVPAAYQRWGIAFNRLREDYPVFNNWVSERLRENDLRQMNGDTLTFCGRSGYDYHLYMRQVKGEYWSQSIRMADGPFHARPNAKEDSWWADLSRRLSEGPLFLVGPGGMGKSAFLAYLYRTVAERRAGREFEGAFLLSLDTILFTAEGAFGTDAAPFNNPNNSILLKHIANRSGNINVCNGWHTAFQKGDHLITGKPVLLLLDGFNELYAKKDFNKDIYQQLIKEIVALSNLNTYRYVRMILTSRIESNQNIDELNMQRSELFGMSFQEGSLKGIVNDVNALDMHLTPEMEELLKRPLYYKYMQDFRDGRFPSNRYEALDAIYQSLCRHSIDNGCTEEEKDFRRCMFEFFLPIAAHYGWRSKALTDETISKAYTEFTEPCCHKMLRNRDMQAIRVDINRVEAFLRGLNQLLAYADHQYVFSHEDYQSFLTAKYFLQRIDYMSSRLDEPFWDDRRVFENLRPNAYDQDILALIYQALSFRTSFIDHFRIHPDGIERLTPGCILWYNVAYQLSDLSGPTGFYYDGGQRQLKDDTLQVLHSLIEYACVEFSVGPPFGAQPIADFRDELRKYIVEILMKSSEAYRTRGTREGVENARRMVEAARYVYRNDPENLPYIVEHNAAHLDLNELFNNNAESLADALQKLYQCATGTPKKKPQRYSCSMLSMLLVSPHRILADRPEYQDFIAQLPLDGSVVFHAFWLAYKAIFDCDKFTEENNWTPRLYYVRQFLFFLAENRVQISRSSDCPFTRNDFFALKRLYDARQITVRVAENGVPPIPAKDNLRFIRIALKEIAGYERNWTYYLRGLVEYKLNGNTVAACEQFSKATGEIRAQLWLAYLDGDIQQLQTVHDDKFVYIQNMPAAWEINTYPQKEYYERDITALYRALRSQLDH